MNHGKPRNPFSVQFHGPGAITYLFEDGAEDEWPNLLAELESTQWRLEITGPHGIGKSTLLHSLLEEAIGRGMTTVYTKVDPAWPHLGPPLWHRCRRTVATFIDSAELLPRWEIKLLRSLSRGLIVTTHEPCILPSVYRPIVSGERFHAILYQLVGDELPRFAKSPDQWLSEAGGCVRQALFNLYDAYERDEVFSPDEAPS